MLCLVGGFFLDALVLNKNVEHADLISLAVLYFGSSRRRVIDGRMEILVDPLKGRWEALDLIDRSVLHELILQSVENRLKNSGGDKANEFRV
jgi:hypothetical protein